MRNQVIRKFSYPAKIEQKARKKCKETHNNLGLSHPIALVWVPGHSDVEGIEVSEKLAKLRSRDENTLR